MQEKLYTKCRLISFLARVARGKFDICHIADKIGRRKTIIIATFSVAALSWVIVWPKYLAVYIICRILTGIVCGM